MVAMSQAQESSFYDIDYVSAVARRLDMAEKTVKPSNATAGSKRSAENIPVSYEAKKSRYAPASDSRAGTSFSSSSSDRNSKLSKFGKTFAQHVADGLCFTCNRTYSKGHRCATAVRTVSPGDATSSRKVLRAMGTKKKPKNTIDAVVKAALLSVRVDEALSTRKKASSSIADPTPTVERSVMKGKSAAGEDVVMNEIHDTNGGTSDDEYDAESDLTERAQAVLVNGMSNVSVDDVLQNIFAQQCKFNAVFSAPPAMRTNSICVPIVVQNIICFGLVDTGATFSCI
ncbi:hypothetical protein BD408DRAFT_427196, partial [Parasitella parasitica]